MLDRTIELFGPDDAQSPVGQQVEVAIGEVALLAGGLEQLLALDVQK